MFMSMDCGKLFKKSSSKFLMEGPRKSLKSHKILGLR